MTPQAEAIVRLDEREGGITSLRFGHQNTAAVDTVRGPARWVYPSGRVVVVAVVKYAEEIPDA